MLRFLRQAFSLIVYSLLYISMAAILFYPLLGKNNFINYDLETHQLIAFFFVIDSIVILIFEFLGRSQDFWQISNLIKWLFGLIALIILINLTLISSKINTPLYGLTQKISSTFKYGKNFINGMFYDIYGYPADPQMATPQELLTEINNYRKTHNLLPIAQKETICQAADRELAEVSAVSYTKNYQVVKKYESILDQVVSGEEIAQAFEVPTSASNIVNLYWWRPFNQQKKVLDSPGWRFGCGTVSNLQVVFIFSQ